MRERSREMSMPIGVKVAISIGVGVGGFLLLCCLWWSVSKLRQSSKSGRVSTTLKEILVERRKGVKKDVVRTFPVVETSELNFDPKSKLQCPTCWLPFRETDSIRQLPHCDHVFHRHCIDPVLENQITCPVCGTVLTDNPKISEQILNGKHKRASAAPAQPPPSYLQVPLRSLYSTSNPKDAEPPSPSWVLVNRPLPLPRTSSSSSDRFEIELNPGESPLITNYLNGTQDWHQPDDIDLDQTCIDISFTFGTDIPVEKRNPTSSSAPADSFSFSTGKRSEPVKGVKDSSRFSDASTRFSRSTSRSSWSTNSSSDSRFDKFDRWDSHQLEEVAEDHHLPLTKPPDECAFDVLPVVTKGYEIPPKVGTNRKTYSQL